MPLAPKVALGQYTGLTVERNKYELTDADMDTQMERMRERAAEYPQVERPVQDGDLVIADVAAEVDARPDAADAPPDHDRDRRGQHPRLRRADHRPERRRREDLHPDLPRATTPRPTWPGEQAEFTVKVNEVREKQVPELDDELARKISNGKIETLDALKADLRADMEKRSCRPPRARSRRGSWTRSSRTPRSSTRPCSWTPRSTRTPRA